MANMINASTQIRTIPRPLCPLCNSPGDLLHSDLMDRMFAAPGTWSLKLCSNISCGLAWLDPAPCDSDIPRLYTTYFTHEQKQFRKRLLLLARSFFYRGYLAASYIPSTFLGIRKARDQISYMYLHDLKPGKFLDVGCGSGALLHRMHKLGWSATGVDFDAKAVENVKARYGSEVTVLHSDLATARFPDASFDAVTMSHVIEHVPNPVALLAEARRILKVGGTLVVTTPNIQSYGHKLFQDCWWGLDSPRHLQVFSSSALAECARAADFAAVTTMTSVANADTFLGGSLSFLQSKLSGDNASGRKIHFNFTRGIRSLLLQYREAFLLRRNPNCGEEAVLICQR